MCIRDRGLGDTGAQHIEGVATAPPDPAQLPTKVLGRDWAPKVSSQKKAPHCFDWKMKKGRAVPVI